MLMSMLLWNGIADENAPVDGNADGDEFAAAGASLNVVRLF